MGSEYTYAYQLPTGEIDTLIGIRRPITLIENQLLWYKTQQQKYVAPPYWYI